MTLQSPFTGESLELIDGDAEGIRRHACNLITSSEAMDRAANRLEDISDGTSDLKSEAISTVRESAKEVFPELRKAAIRYNGTGEALKTYAAALESVQGVFAQCTARGGVDSYASLSALISDIESANENAISKRNSEDEAQDLVSEHDGFLGMGEGTDEQKEEAAEGLSAATTARETAEAELDELWGKFDGRVSYWEDAYDQAVYDIEEAFDAAGNNDHALADFTDFLTAVSIVVGLAALILTGPIALILGAIALAASVVLLGIEIYKMAVGDGSWVDLGFAIIGLVPFGRVLGKVFTSIGKGSKGFSGFFKSVTKTRTSQSRGIVRSSVKAPGRRPKMTKVKGKGPRRKQIRRQNDVKKQRFKNAHDRQKRNYMQGFDDSFSKNKFKMILTYVLDGGTAKERALAEYVLAHPHQVTRNAQEWAKMTKDVAHAEEFMSWAIALGLGAGQEKINEVNQDRRDEQFG